jgi:hypothetical protein
MGISLQRLEWPLERADVYPRIIAHNSKLPQGCKTFNKRVCRIVSVRTSLAAVLDSDSTLSYLIPGLLLLERIHAHRLVADVC